MKRALIAYGILAVIFSVFGAIVFRCSWGSAFVFSGGDANIGLIQSAKTRLPQSLIGAFTPTPLFGSTGVSSLSVRHIGQFLLPADIFTDTWFAFYLIVASLAFIAYLRLWAIGWISCIFGALSAFWVGSVTLAAAGHLGKLGVMAMCCLSLFMIEKAVRGSFRQRIAYSLLAGMCIGLMLLEQEDVGLLSGIFLGVYAIYRLVFTAGKAWTHWLQVLLPVAVIGLALSGYSALSAYESNVVDVGVTKDPQQQWNFVTQWSMVPSEWPELIAPGYAGWHTGHPTAPYWGKVGQSPDWALTKAGFRNFRLDSLYIGMLPVLFGAFGLFAAIQSMLAKRRVGKAGKDSSNKNSEVAIAPNSFQKDLPGIMVLWALLAVLAFVLACGKYMPIYRLFFQMPLVGNIRAPIKLLHHFQLIIGILAAYGLNHLLTTPALRSNRFLRNSAIIAGVITFVALVLALSARTPSFTSTFAEWGNLATNLAIGVSRAWLHAAVMAALFGILCFCIYRFRVSSNRIRYWGVIPVAAVCFDALFLTTQYFRSDDISVMRSPNPVIDYLKTNQGVDRSFCFSQQGIYNLWISRDFIYHGINNFNFGQMPRMPLDLEAFLREVGGNWPRLMQLASCRYGLVPAPIFSQIYADESMRRAVQPVSGFRFVQNRGDVTTEWLKQVSKQSDQILFEYKNALPRLGLFAHWETAAEQAILKELSDPDSNPLNTVYVSESTPSKQTSIASPTAVVPIRPKAADHVKILAEMNTKTGGIVLFTQRYHPGWTVTVNGTPAPLLKCNYLNMGVYVPPGNVTVEFRCPRNYRKLTMQISGLLFSILTAGSLLIIHPKRKVNS